MNETKIEQIALDRIKPSKTNPRKHFDVAYISELSDSIRQKGIIQPLTVRPDWCIGKDDDEIEALNGNAPASKFFEIVAGECRFRGAVEAEQGNAPSIVRLLSDKETLEIQVIENLQRSDLTALEEAEGYRRLRDEYGYTVELIHERTGKTKRTIYGKLKILNAPKVLLDALMKEVVSEGHCELVARIPVVEMRERAAQEILQPKFLQENRNGALAAVTDQPMSLRVARAHVKDNYMRSLAGAEFDLEKADLVDVHNDDQTGERIGGGACTDCPMRSGNQPDLMGDLKRPDICANPKCFALKQNAHFTLLQKNAEAEGKKVLSADEAAGLFENDGDLWFDSPYAKLADKPDPQELRADVKKVPTWAKILEGIESKPQIAIAADPKGRTVELVDRKLAIEAVNLAAKAKNEVSIFDLGAGRAGSRSTKSGDSGRADQPEPAWKAQERRNREISKFNFAVTLAGLGVLVDAVDKQGLVPGLVDALIEASIDHAGHDGCWLMCKRIGLDPKAVKKKSPVGSDVEEAVREYSQSLTDENFKLGFLVELLLSKRLRIYNSMGGLRSVDAFKPFAKLFGIKIDEIEKNVRAESNDQKKKNILSGCAASSNGRKREVGHGNETSSAAVSPNPEVGASSTVGKAQPRATAATHKFEKIADNKYRCECGAFAVKQKGKFILAKDHRGKPCSRKIENPKKPKAKKVKAKSKRKAVRK